MPVRGTKADIGTMIRQCMQGATCAKLDQAGLAGYYTLHDHGVLPVDPNGVPFATAYIACTFSHCHSGPVLQGKGREKN